MSYFYFFSYSRDDQGAYLDRFHEDLRREVARLTEMSYQDVAYRDTHSVEAGTRWNPALRSALSETRILVSLISPAYRQSDFCGKEYTVFIEREAIRDKDLPEPDPHTGILPVLWKLDDESRVPQVIMDRQLHDISLPEEYRSEGLEYILRNQKEDTYRKVIDILGQKIFAAGERARLPRHPNILDFELARNAFEDAPEDAADSKKTDQSQGGADVARFVYVVASPEEMRNAAIRQDLECYVPSVFKWRPFYPPTDEGIGSAISKVTKKLDIEYDRIDLDETAAANLERASSRNEIIVFVVDAWTLRLQQYEDRLKKCAKAVQNNFAVIVPLNSGDKETVDAMNVLEARITWNLDYARKRQMYFSQAENQRQLVRQLERMIARIQTDICNFNRVQRGTGDTSQSLPGIIGPSGD
jgi:FxsC-like protein